MRLICLGDIHGNIEALRAVLNDALSTYDSLIDGFVFLGDYCCDFIEGEECMRLIQKIQQRYKTYFISGNRETGMVESYRKIKEESGNLWSYDSTMGAVRLDCEKMSDETVEFLTNLPSEMTINLKGTTPIFCQHKMPLTEEKIRELEENGVKTVLTAHTHEPHAQQYGDLKLYNPGSVGLTDNGIPGADYAVMTFKNGGWIFERKHVDYDYQKEIENIKSNDILMNQCKGWGHALIKSVETGINVTAMYMFEKNKIAKEYAESIESSTPSFGTGRYANVSPDNDYLKEQLISLSNDGGDFVPQYFKTESFTSAKNYPVEDWMYEEALKRVIERLEELQSNNMVESTVYTERRFK